MTELRDSRVLITGAASGIGRLMALKAAAGGAQLVLWDLDEAGLGKLREEIVATGGTASGYVCNLADRQAIFETAQRTRAECGDIDVLINNAGVVSGKELLELSDRQIETTFAVNTLALFWMTREFLPAMLMRNRGHLVTVASAGGVVGTAQLTDYCASKFAAVGFDESLRLELRRLNSAVRTTVVCPFYINTGMFEGVKTRFPWLLPILEPEYVADRILRAIAKNHARVVTPRFVYSSWLARVLPTPAFDALMSFFGISKSMDEFAGRSR